MKTTGRNDPCPCGSGKKFKKCCLVSVEANDFEYRRQRQLEASLIRRLMEYAFSILDPNAIHDAWIEFNDFENVEPLEPDSPMKMLFIPWLLFNWLYQDVAEDSGLFGQTTIAQSFLSFYKFDLTSDEIRFLETADRLPYSLCEVIQLKRGIGMVMRDLFTHDECEIAERMASETFNVGDIIYCATLQIGNIRSNLATGPFALGPTEKREVLKLRQEIVDEIEDDNVTKLELEEFENEIRDLYLNSLDEMFRPPQILNTDKEPFLPQKVYFDLQSVDEAYHRLKGLAGEENEKRLLRQATIEDGAIVAADIPWAGGKAKAKERFGNPVLLGVLKLNEGRLIAEVNSTARAEAIRKIIEERLGDQVTYKTTSREPIDIPFTEMWEEAESGSADDGRSTRRARAALGREIVGGGSDPRSSSPFLDIDEPEVRALLKQLSQQHWDTWFDIPVFALNDTTPREAAKSAEGRNLLESLLLEYEARNAASPDSFMCPDIPALRRELGLE